MLTLPRPDDFGNYYLYTQGKGKTLIAAIFRSKRRDGHDIHDNGAFFVITNDSIITNGDGLKYFDDPQQALNAINSRNKVKV